MRLLRAAPATVYVAALSIAIAYGSPALYPGGGQAGDAQRSPATSLLSTSDISYHFDHREPSVLDGVSFRAAGDPSDVTATLTGHELDCRELADGRWYCPANGRIRIGDLSALRITGALGR